MTGTTTGTTAYETIGVTEMSPACGATIEGVDLSGALTNRQFDEIHAALLDRTVIVFRDQQLTQAQQADFARRFGEVQPSSASGFEKSDEHPDVDILEYDAENPPHITRDLWHIDFVGTARPTMGTVLYAKDIPPGGGDTIWVNAVAAYEALSDRMQAHPVVRAHPETGKKGIFVNESMTTFIKGMDRRESDFLLQFLFDWLRTPEFNYRHKWRANDLAVWDNRTSLHYALFDYTAHRLMHRVVIAGDVPHE
jgi:taurine dioxygenase